MSARIFIALILAASICRADLHSFSQAKQAARDGVVRFTYDAVVSIDPVITSTLGDTEFRWTKPNGDTFYGKAPSGTNWTETGTYVLWCSDWSKLSQLDHSSDAGLIAFDAGYRHLRPLTSLSKLRLYSTDVSGDISGWTLPSSLGQLRLYYTDVSGDISGWTLPSSLSQLYLYYTDVSGDISGWTLPSSLGQLSLNYTDVSGDISGWTLPSSLGQLSLNSTDVSGDISGWTLPSSLSQLYLYYTDVSGDISGWTLPSSLSQLYLYSTDVSGDISGWTLPSSLDSMRLYSTDVDYDSSSGCLTNTPSGILEISMQDCTLTTNQVDNILIDCDTSGVATNGTASITLNVAGDNATPSATGLTAYTNLLANGWTVTRN